MLRSNNCLEAVARNARVVIFTWIKLYCVDIDLSMKIFVGL